MYHSEWGSFRFQGTLYMLIILFIKHCSKKETQIVFTHGGNDIKDTGAQVDCSMSQRNTNMHEHCVTLSTALHLKWPPSCTTVCVHCGTACVLV